VTRSPSPICRSTSCKWAEWHLREEVVHNILRIMTNLDPRAELFGSLFVLVQHLSRRVDEQVAPLGLTSRQWLLLAVVQKWFPGRHPTLTEAAARYGASRQNVRQIATVLERRGWLRLAPDPEDRRVTRLVLSDRMSVFARAEVEHQGAALLDSVFAGASDEDLADLRGFVLALIARLEGGAETVEGVAR
jgi:DNA-binding MarR family transcriptional regulator